MSVILTPNQSIVCAPTTLSDDLINYDWFINAANWQDTGSNILTVGAYGGVQIFALDVGDGFLPYTLEYEQTIVTDCDFVLYNVLFDFVSYTGTITVSNAIASAGTGVVITGSGWWSFLLPKNTKPNFSYQGLAGITRISNLQAYCVTAAPDCDCRHGDYIQPILAECVVPDSVAEMMAAIRAEWIAESTTYESPLCVAEVLESLAETGTGICDMTSEGVTVQYPAVIGADVVLNGSFASGANWTPSGRMSIGSGSLNCNATVGGAECFQTCLIVGNYYKITLTVSGSTGGEVKVQLGTLNTIGTVSTNATVTLYGKCITDGKLIFEASASAAFNGSIDNVSARPISIFEFTALFDSGLSLGFTQDFIQVEDDIVFQRMTLNPTTDPVAITKDCFRVFVYNSHNESVSTAYEPEYCLTEPWQITTNACGTLLLTALMATSTSSWGWVFPVENNGIYSPRMRVFADLTEPKFPTELDQFETSGYAISLIYGERRKVSLLKINRSPLYVHEFISLACRTDLFTIRQADGTADFYFTNTEEYTPQWIRTMRIAPATIEVQVKQQDTVKNLCD